jgi:hypothetical protein
MELPGPETTRALTGELAAATEAKQILLLQALGIGVMPMLCPR